MATFNSRHRDSITSMFHAGVESQRRRSRGSRSSSGASSPSRLASPIPQPRSETSLSSSTSSAERPAFTNPWSARNSPVPNTPATPRHPPAHKRVFTEPSSFHSQYDTPPRERKVTFVGFSPLAEIYDHVEPDGTRFNLITPTKKHDGGGRIVPRKKSKEDEVLNCFLDTDPEVKDSKVVGKFAVFSHEYRDRHHDIAKKEPWPKHQLEEIRKKEFHFREKATIDVSQRS